MNQSAGMVAARGQLGNQCGRMITAGTWLRAGASDAETGFYWGGENICAAVKWMHKALL